MTSRAIVVAMCGLAGCFGDPPTVDNATDEPSETASSSASGTIDPSTSMATTIDPPDSAGTTTGVETTASSVDATSVDPDATADSGVEVVAFCDAIAAMVGPVMACHDFDDSPGVLGGWQYNELDGASVKVIEDASAPSPPNVLQASFEAGSGNAPFAETTATMPVLTAPLHVRARMELGQCDGPTPLMMVRFPGDSLFEARIVHTGSTLVVEAVLAGGETSSTELDAAVLGGADEWPELGMDIDILDGYVNVLVDGEDAAQLPGLAVPLNPTEPSIHFGALGGEPTHGCYVLFDDIVAY